MKKEKKQDIHGLKADLQRHKQTISGVAQRNRYDREAADSGCIVIDYEAYRKAEARTVAITFLVGLSLLILGIALGYDLGMRDAAKAFLALKGMVF